ncbi:hypothetical protein Hanom_Chr08g00687371 [Helianthus anomalus]
MKKPNLKRKKKLKQMKLENKFFFEWQIWITDGPLEYHRVTNITTRSSPSPLGNNAYTPI